MDEARERMLEIFTTSENSKDPLSWFEGLYCSSRRDRNLIPWDWMEPHPFLVEWIEENQHTGRALVVGSGLGEDCLLYTSPSPRDGLLSRMPSSA